VWIFGAARCGSTWFLELLSWFSELACWNEPNVLSLYRGIETAENGDQRRVGDYALNGATLRQVDDCVRRIVLSEIERRFPEKCWRRYVLKEVTQSVAAEHALRCFPRGRAIFLWRDPLDVLDSRLDAERTWRGRSPVGGLPESALDALAAQDVRASFRGAWAARELWPSQARMTLRFEELVAAPESTLARVLDFLEVEWDLAEVRAAIVANSFEQYAVTGPGQFRRFGQAGSWRRSRGDRRLHPALSEIRQSLGYV
jgi:hypothetical protein